VHLASDARARPLESAQNLRNAAEKQARRGRPGLPIGAASDMLRHIRHIKERVMIHELRIYHCVSGRLPALLKRFETITLGIWARHGIRQAGFWTVVIGESNQDLYYLLEWESLAERETKWGAFQADPEWIAKRAETEQDGPIVASLASMILQPTTFSAVK
jgi:hypothetical protein